MPSGDYNPFSVTVSSPKPTAEEIQAEREAEEREEKLKAALELRIKELEERLVDINTQQNLEAQQ
jgi:hypothetical protein